jgi:hypothetical protein
MCFRSSVTLDGEQTAAAPAGRGKSGKIREFAQSIALSGATVNLIWCPNEGAQWQSVDRKIRFDGT